MTSITSGRFEMGRVIGNTFEVLGRNIIPFLLLSLALSGVPAFVQQMFAVRTTMGLGDVQSSFFIGLGFGLLKLILSFVLQGALVSGAIADLNGKRVDLGAMLTRGSEMVLPLLGLSILQGIAIGFGILLLIVPGLILMTMWAVTVPALVMERKGVMEAFGRSGDLTAGHRWAVFGLMVLYVVIVWIISLVGGGIMVATRFGVDGLAAAGGGGGSFVVPAILAAVLGTLFGAISSAGVAALYYELRLVRDGVAPQAVFDTFS